MQEIDKSIRVELTSEPIDPGELDRWVGHSSNGASLVFLGKVREFNLGREVLGVSYDAFEPLAVKILREICRQAREASDEPNLRIAVAHRLGRLGVGDISVVIAVGSPHRSEAYEASRFVIEELKERVPIWKKEHYTDGDSEWLQGHALCAHRYPPDQVMKRARSA